MALSERIVSGVMPEPVRAQGGPDDVLSGPPAKRTHLRGRFEKVAAKPATSAYFQPSSCRPPLSLIEFSLVHFCFCHHSIEEYSTHACSPPISSPILCRGVVWTSALAELSRASLWFTTAVSAAGPGRGTGSPVLQVQPIHGRLRRAKSFTTRILKAADGTGQWSTALELWPSRPPSPTGQLSPNGPTLHWSAHPGGRPRPRQPAAREGRCKRGAVALMHAV